jgi:NADPH-dependent curcumin reductase CurA
LKKIGELKPGETLVVSGAAGSVGTTACQLGKAAGAKVYAIAGSDDKCRWLEKELGVDRAFNYKSKTFFQDMKSIGYLDVYFDNVGGEIFFSAPRSDIDSIGRRYSGLPAYSSKKGCPDCSLR